VRASIPGRWPVHVGEPAPERASGETISVAVWQPARTGRSVRRAHTLGMPHRRVPFAGLRRLTRSALSFCANGV